MCETAIVYIVAHKIKFNGKQVALEFLSEVTFSYHSNENNYTQQSGLYWMYVLDLYYTSIYPVLN